MNTLKQNDYGCLCTEMYEILHAKAPQDELDFYLSYAKKGEKILEPLCGSGRFLIPFMEKGYTVSGIDASGEMLAKLKRKAPAAHVIHADIAAYDFQERYDYIFIPSSSVSLFTDSSVCKTILHKLKNLLLPKGRLVFSVDTVSERCPDDSEYKTAASVKTEKGFDLILRSRNYYDERTQTQFSPGVYELYRGSVLLKRECMDFQTHLYKYGEMERILKEIGFTAVSVYSSFSKEFAANARCKTFLFECILE